MFWTGAEMKIRNPTLTQLHYFVAVADQKSFRRAAERLRISQPTLTAQIAGLEKALSVQLFERSRGGTFIAPAGRELLGAAQRVLEEVRALMDAAGGSRAGPGGTYRMGVPPTLGPYLLPHILPDLHQRYEAFRLHVREDLTQRLEEGLVTGRYDFVVMPLPLVADEFIVTPLFREPILLALPMQHPLASKPAITGADLFQQDVLTIEGQHPYHRQVESLCERFGARVLRDYEGTSLDALRHMVVMGMGLAFLPALYVRSEIHDPGAIRVTGLDGETISRIHALIWRPASPARQFYVQLAADIREILTRRLGDVVTQVR